MSLLEAGASPNCTDRRGLNSLHLAVVSNCTECLRSLLTLGRHPVDLDAMNYEGNIFHFPVTFVSLQVFAIPYEVLMSCHRGA